MPITENEEETFRLGQEIAEKVENGGVICLFGDLGTGKTTLTKAIVENFGIDKIQIKSPTYTYIREHIGQKGEKIFHIDLYRLNDIDELLLQEINELLEDKANIVIIEWADRMKNHLPLDRINIFLEYVDENRRNIKIV